MYILVCVIVAVSQYSFLLDVVLDTKYPRRDEFGDTNCPKQEG